MKSASGILQRWAGAALCFLPAILLAVLAGPHFLDGLALDAAVPVTDFMIAHRPVPKSAYAEAAAALSGTNPRDGSAKIAQAEAALLAGALPRSQTGTLIAALAYEPGSARGWTLLAETLLATDPGRAARALSLGLMLDPNDYWLVHAMAQDAALLWSRLDANAQARALKQARLLWEEPALRPQLSSLLVSRGGIALVARAFAGRQNELRSMNRWLSAAQRRTTGPRQEYP